MAPELIYMLKVNTGIALFYAFYRLFCCRDTFFQWRRIALLSFLVLSFLYPLLNIQNWVKEQPAISELADYYALLMMTNTAATNAATATETAGALPMPSLMNLLIIVYLCGVCLLSLRFIIQLLSIFRLAMKSKEVTIGNVRVRSLSSPASPFSFWQWVFIYLPGVGNEERQEILTHELTHTRQWHSIDVIFSEIVNIICWMNPFSWLLKTEIRLNLEYLADHKVVQSVTDMRLYQYHLLGLANQGKQTGLYNNFNLSHLKNRIMMMNKQRTCTTGCIKYALFAPLAAALLLVSNIETVARTAAELVAPPTEATSKATEVEKAESIQQDGKGITTFHVTIVDNQGKKVPDVKIQTKINDELLTFTTGKDGKVDIKLAMGNLKSAYMHAAAPSGKEYYFFLSPGTTETTVNIDKYQPAPPLPGPDADGIYSVVEVMPEFPGGMQGCLEFISKNIKYPVEAQEKKIMGKVIVQFVVEKDGSLSGFKVVRSVDEILDNEAIRVLKMMPKWTPGTVKGEAVRCKYTLPVAFSMR